MNILQSYTFKLFISSDKLINSNGGLLDDDLQLIKFNLIDFSQDFSKIYSVCNRIQQQAKSVSGAGSNEMRTFEQSSKSKKTVASMIIQNKNIPNTVQAEKEKAEKIKAAEEAKAQNKNGTLTKEEILKKLSGMGSPKAGKKGTFCFC